MTARTGVPGVTITSGLVDWQVLPREADDTATVLLRGTVSPAAISPEPPFTFTAVEAEVTVSARVVSELDGGAVVPWVRATLAPDASWEVTLRLPVGGGYRVETQLEQAGGNGYSLTRGDLVHHVAVGDLYLVIGQSNASGRARDRVVDGPQLGVHHYRADGTWALAAHPLNDGTRAVHTGHFENHNTGHSPALHFAKRVAVGSGVPVGLVMASFGGSPLRWWVDGGELAPLAENALEMMAAAGGRPRGVLWYQGEADCFELSTADYAERFAMLVALLRTRLETPTLPFYTAQLARCTMQVEDDQDSQWGMLREQQRQAAHRLDGVHLVPTGDLPLYDFIHLSSAANLVLADRLADAALAEGYGLPRDWRAPEPVEVARSDARTVRLAFAPIRNWINDYGLPVARCPFTIVDSDGTVPLAGWSVEGHSIVLSLARELSGAAFAHGMWQMDHGGIVPADCTRLPFLSFYGVPVR